MLQLGDGEVLDDPFLDLLEVVVILVEDTSGAAQIEIVVSWSRSRAERGSNRDTCV